jgi:glycine/D-amino acid oxidase-like deaminating enzyme
MAIKTETLAQHVERCYRTENWDSLTEIYAPEVLLDVNVPSWRFQIQGRDAPIGWFKEQIARFENFRVTWVQATPTEDGVVVEWEMHTSEGDNEQLCRQVDILHGDGARIHTHVVLCTGMWDPATIARQRTEAPMVRW